jgi:hypothetical protein
MTAPGWRPDLAAKGRERQEMTGLTLLIQRGAAFQFNGLPH